MRAATTGQVVYPDSDGRPIADNTKQYRYIVTIKGGLDVVFKDDPNVFVAGDNLWYPVQCDPKTRTAPDVYVAFGRPKGDRGSYLQWEEGGVPLTVVFEVMSPGNRAGRMRAKFDFYDRFGVEEYYVYDPDRGTLQGYRRAGSSLVAVPQMQNYVSPRLGVRFELTPDGELNLYGPDGRKFLDVADYAEQADTERQRAEAEWRRAEAESRRADDAERRATELADKLRALGHEPP